MVIVESGTQIHLRWTNRYYKTTGSYAQSTRYFLPPNTGFGFFLNQNQGYAFTYQRNFAYDQVLKVLGISATTVQTGWLGWVEMPCNNNGKTRGKDNPIWKSCNYE